MNALPAERKPLNPYLVLAIAIALPGMGHVAIGQQQRGFMFAMFTLLLSLLTWHISSPDRSFIGRTAIGLFVWALSIPDAYRIARMNWEMWKRKHPS